MHSIVNTEQAEACNDLPINAGKPAAPGDHRRSATPRRTRSDAAINHRHERRSP